MTYRLVLPALALVALTPAARAVEPSELKPGLVAKFVGQTSAPPVIRLEPTVAVTIKPGGAAHPRLTGTSTIRWEGYLNVVRPGKYIFSATARGGMLAVDVKGKLVLAAVEDKVFEGGEVTLDGGVQLFHATYTTANPTGGAQVELRWEGPGFHKEPVPHQFLGHLPKQRPAGFTKDVQLEHGRFLFEELACARCHQPAAGDAMAKTLADRPAPNLTDVAKRSHAGWIDAWLADPAKLRPHTTMPRLFADDAAGRTERYAVVKYLVSLAGRPLPTNRPAAISNGDRQSMERGRVLFTVTGCAACHTIPQPKKPANDEDEKEPLRPEDYVYSAGTAGPAAKYSLGAPGSKYRPDTLAAYLQNPLKVNPAGRMPHLNLNGGEANDIARYLCRVVDDSIEPGMPDGSKLNPSRIAAEVFAAHGTAPGEYAAFKKLPADSQWLDLGRKLLVTKGCVNCHAVEPGGKPITAAASFPLLEAVKKAGAGHGCLSPQPTAGAVPAYKLDAKESAAVAAFLKDGLTGAGSSAPTHAARVALRRFNCLNCHTRDGEGGLAPELADQMRLLEKAENADDVRPPLLTGVGHKLRTPWLTGVLTDGKRARPWVQLRMPQYGPANVGALPASFALLEGTAPDETTHAVPVTAEKIAAGRALVGKGGLGCISCHDIAGIPNPGTRGPDLATVNNRVRYDWYERWLHQPLRMAPGTRMPQAFVDGKSTLTTILNGNPAAQAEAMWAYLSLGPGLPLPEGVEPPKGVVIAAKNRPELLRTFLPDAGTKAIAVGYPGGVSVAFDGDQCRLAYGWAGNFLDASPVWNNRGGAPAKLLGPKFWTAPAGHPWGLTTNANLPPDFAGRANSPAFGTTLPLEPARIYTGLRAVRFDGYSLAADGRPTFRYTLAEGKSAVLTVAETPVPLKSAIAAGVARRFEAELPGDYRAWLLAGDAVRTPRAIRADGTTVPATTPDHAVPANGVKVVLPADGDRATVLELVGAPAGTAWRFVPKPGGGWFAVVRLPETKTPVKVAFALNVWGLPKDDDALLPGLGAK